MLILICLLILIVIVNFLFKKNQQAAQIQKEGGMKHKYRYLVQFILDSDPQCKVMFQSSDMITLGISNYSGSTIFSLVQTFGHITIEWKVKNVVYGNHRLEWTFSEFEDQNLMSNKISNDLEAYQKNVMTKFS